MTRTTKRMTYPSVTEILAKYCDFSVVRPEVLEAACNRGSWVHAYCAAYAQNLWMSAPDGLEGYCQSFKNWFDAMVVKVILVEHELVDKVYGYVGHLDLLALLKGDKQPSVVDYKTPLTKGATWGGQGAAYLNLAKKYKPWRFGSLRLKADGGPAIFDPYQETKRDFQAFVNALYAHRYFLGKE